MPVCEPNGQYVSRSIVALNEGRWVHRVHVVPALKLNVLSTSWQQPGRGCLGVWVLDQRADGIQNMRIKRNERTKTDSNGETRRSGHKLCFAQPHLVVS